MRIGELAKVAGVTLRTIRYYESVGLMPKGFRADGGQHYYAADAVMRLRKIDQLKSLGLSLEEISTVIELYFLDPSGALPKERVLALLRQHLRDVDQKRRAINQVRDDLIKHIARFEDWFGQKARQEKECSDD